MRIFCIVLCLLLSLTASSVKADDGLVKVTLKTGTVVSGKIVSFDPSSAVTIDMAGLITSIPMDKVEKIERETVAVQQSTNVATQPIPRKEALSEPPTHEPVQAVLSSAISQGRKGNDTFSAQTPDGLELNYRVLSNEERTLAVIKGRYHESRYIIPETVDVNGTIYTVTEIGEKAFYLEGTVREVQFPATLRRIGLSAFQGASLESIVINDGLESIEGCAFWACNLRGNVREIYVPKSVQQIGTSCFFYCGRNLSPRGFTQARVTCMPDFVTESNSSSYGIDDAAIKRYREELRESNR